MAYTGTPGIDFSSGLTSMKRLREAGVKGMKWGARKAQDHVSNSYTGDGGDEKLGDALENNRKSSSWNKVSTLKSYSPDTQKAIDALPVVKANPKSPIEDYKGHDGLPHILQMSNGSRYLVEPQGYTYARYAVKLGKK